MQQGPAYLSFTITVPRRQGEFLTKRRETLGASVSKTIQIALDNTYPEIQQESDTEAATEAEPIAAAV